MRKSSASRWCVLKDVLNDLGFFKSSPQELRSVVSFQWEEPSVLIRAYPGVGGHVKFAQRAHSHLVLQARCSLNYQQQTRAEGKQILCTPQQQLRGQLNLPPLPLWERKMSWVMDTNSFYRSHVVLLTCMVAKGNVTQLLKMIKNYSYEHIFYIGLVSDFSLAHRCKRAIPVYMHKQLM